MSPHLTILRKGLFLIAVPLLFQVIFIGLLAKIRRDGNLAVEWTIHTKDVIAQAQTSRVALLEAHGAVQGLVITREPKFGAIIDRWTTRAPIEIGNLKALVSDRADQTQAASKLRDQAIEFLDFLLEGRALFLENRLDATLAAARRTRAQGLLDELEGGFDRFIGFERELDMIRQESLRRSGLALESLLVGGLTTSVFFTIILAILFSKNISGRITSLTHNTHRLAEGQALLPPIGGQDEISRLDQVFHDMARTLAQAAQREKDHSKLLERRAEELDSINAQLREKAQENEMFVYSVSHDLRSPLVNLQGFGKELGMIGKDLRKLLDEDSVPPEVRRKARVMIETDMGESIGFIQSAVTRLSGIIDGLLRLSRARQVEYRRQSVEVGPIVARIVTALRGTIEERDATVRVGELPPAWGDPSAIDQIFANLIGNAVNYLDRSRPGKIEVFAVDPIEASGLTQPVPPGAVVYAIRDNGLGISDSYKSKVFTAFQRLHGDVAKGEGIGLALVRRVVERHEGSVWFDSRPGEGTTFFVALPSSQPKAGESFEDDEHEASLVSTETENGRATA